MRLAAILFVSTQLTLPSTELPPTTADLGLPAHIAYKTLFPQVVFGTFGPFEASTEFLLINPTDESAFVDFRFFLDDGSSAADLIGRDGAAPLEWRRSPNVRRFGDRFWMTLPRHSTIRLKLPGEEPRDPPVTLSSWAFFRSNQPIQITETFRLDHPQTETTSVSTIPGNELGALEFIKSAFKTQCSSGDEGFNVKETMAAIVNPNVETLELQVQTGGLTADGEWLVLSRHPITIQPQSRTTFSVSGLIGLTPGCVSSQRVRIVSPQGRPFGAILVDLRSRVRKNGQLWPDGFESPLQWLVPSWRSRETQPFEAPADIKEAEIAVVYGTTPSAIIFLRSGNVLLLETYLRAPPRSYSRGRKCRRRD